MERVARQESSDHSHAHERGRIPARNQEILNKLITQAIESGYKHTVIVGDFNFPEINWESWSVSSSETHPAFKFIECLRDNFLFQHVHSTIRHRFEQ